MSEKRARRAHMRRSHLASLFIGVTRQSSRSNGTMRRIFDPDQEHEARSADNQRARRASPAPQSEGALMADPVAVWHAEHTRFASLLDSLEQQMMGIHSGRGPQIEMRRPAVVEAPPAPSLLYSRHHLAMEEKNILPGAARVLKPDDWAAVAAAVPA